MAKKIDALGRTVDFEAEAKPSTLEDSAAEINSASTAQSEVDLCAVEPLKPSDSECEPTPGGPSDTKAKDEMLASAVALGQAMNDAAVKANAIPDPFMDDPSCELGLNSEVEKSIKSLQ